MAEPFVGQISLFAGNYAPQGYAFCNGALLNINNYQPLYSLIGTAYGGDGVNTFGLPDMQGRIPVGPGIATGGGQINWQVGQKAGAEQVALSEAQIPSHNHPLQATSEQATVTNPLGNLMAADAGGAADFSFSTGGTAVKPFLPQAVSNTGAGQAHDNVAPFMVLNYIIALTGVYPSRP